MPTYRVCPAASASGIHKPRRGAIYGYRETISTIAPADHSTKPAVQIRQAVWNYKPGRVTLVKGTR